MRVGSLCTGYGGLDMAVERVLGGELAWYAENERHPSTLLARRFPGIPNLGDITTLDWSAVEPVDILTGGYPCQPFSDAGKKLGEGDERYIWPYIREAVRTLRPRIAIFENVTGHLGRGFAAVLRDAAEDGFDARWLALRASDVGAPHSRDRMFFIVTDADVPRPQGDRFQPRGHDAPGERPRVDDRLPRAFQWAEYADAIAAWEAILGRPAPHPVEPNANGRPRPTAVFYEWMMGLPEGWVTGVPIPYTAQIKLLGNGVVPQQAAAAITALLELVA